MKSDWTFLYDATKEEIRVLNEAFKESNLGEIVNYHPEMIINSLPEKFTLRKNFSSYSEFVSSICAEISIPREYPVVEIEYQVLAYMLIDLIGICPDTKIAQIAKVLQFSNTNMNSLKREILARLSNSLTFRKQLPYAVLSIYGIHIKNSIGTLPIIDSSDSISYYISRITDSKDGLGFLTEIFKKTSVAAGAVASGTVAGALFGGPLVWFAAGTALAKGIEFFNKANLRDKYPAIAAIILIRQEHTSSFENAMCAKEYTNMILRAQDVFEWDEDAAVSFAIQLNEVRRKKKDISSELLKNIDTYILKEKRLDLPKYRLKMFTPFIEEVNFCLYTWIKRAYGDERFIVEQSGEKEASLINEFSKQLFGKPIRKEKKQELLDCKSIDCIESSETKAEETTLVEGINGEQAKVDKLLEEDYEKIRRQLESEIRELQHEIEIDRINFEMIRHDISDKLGKVVRPLNYYVNYGPDKFTIEDAKESIKVFEVIKYLIENVGKESFGVIVPGKKYCISELVKKAFRDKSYTFLWDETAELSLCVSIPKGEFIYRVLGNLESNFVRHAFSTKSFINKNAKDKKIRCNIYRSEGKTTLILENNGEKISPDDIQHIFDNGAKFGENGHTGVGLSYVKQFMTFWKGEITAEVPQNSEYTIRFIFKFDN